MDYVVSKIKFGTSNKTLIAKLNTRSAIRDLCYINNLGFVFIHSGVIGLVNLKGQINYGFIIDNVEDPVSLCYSTKHYICCVLEKGGKSLKYFELKDNNLIPFLGDVYQRKLNELLKNFSIDTICSYGCLDDDKNVYYMYNDLNKGLKFTNSEFKHFIGKGKSGYSSSNDLLGLMFNKPSGIAFYDRKFYIADTGNHCVRLLNGTLSTLIGSPFDSSLNPTKISVKNKLGYFISSDQIYYFTLEGKNGSCYRSEKLVSFDMDEQKNLYVVETL